MDSVYCLYSVISLLILLIGYQYIVKHHGLVYSPRFFGLALLFWSTLAIWHHFVVPPGEEILPDSLPRGGGLLAGGLLLMLPRCPRCGLTMVPKYLAEGQFVDMQRRMEDTWNSWKEGETPC